MSRVEFRADRVDLVGDLRLPGGRGPFPALALTGPFTGVKEQVTGTYARTFTERGFATLALDHRGFGESGGRRGHEDSQGKLADLRAAVGALAEHPGVAADRIGLVGICLGGGYAVRAVSLDPRVRAVAGIAGGYNSPARFAEAMGLDTYRATLATLLQHYDDTLPAVAAGDGEAAMPGEEPYAYYGTSRGAASHWENEVTRGSLYSLLTFDALGAADLLGQTPLLVVHGREDAYCAPELAVELHERTAGDKVMHWVDCERHTDLYDVEPHVGTAIEATAKFMDAYLS